MASRRGHGEGSIYKRSRDGRWVAQIDLGYIGGKRARRTFTGKTQAQVRQRLQVAQQQVQSDGVLPKAPPTLRDFLEIWITEVVKPGPRSEKTKTFYIGNARRHLIPDLGDIRLDRLTARDVQHLLTLKSECGLSDRTVQAIHSTLRVAIDVAVRWGYVSQNVVKVVVAPRPQRDPDRVHALGRADVLALIKASVEIRHGAMIPVLLMTGMRKGELLALTWDNIDLQAGTLTIARSAFRSSGNGMQTKGTKTQRARMVSLPRQAVEVLKTQRRHQRTLQLAAGPYWNDLHLVFSTDLGGLLDENVPNTTLKRACRLAGLREERVHNLRHTAAMTAADVTGGDLHAVKDLLGHASISTTFDIYGHRMTESQHRLGKAMSTWFDGDEGDRASAQ